MKKFISLTTATFLSLQMSVISPSVFAEEANPDLAALAEQYGFNTDTFQFPNFIPDGENIATEAIDEEIFTIRNEKFTFEEGLHNAANLYNCTAAGCCYGMSAISVLIHNGVLSVDDLQTGAETLHDIAFDGETIGRRILQYSLSQIYLDVQFANLKDQCLKADEERVADLLALAKRCQESNRYFMIAYSGLVGENTLNHAVVGIGTAEGSWTFDDMIYDTCILTYDSNAVKKDDTSVAGGFTEKLCIYINSETNQFYIPAYGISSANEGFIFYATDSAERLQYRSELNGTDTVDEDISGLAQMSQYSNSYGIEVSASNETSEWIDISDKIKNTLATMWGNEFFIYPASSYHIEQNQSAESGDDSDIYGSIMGKNPYGEGFYCTRYGAGGYENPDGGLKPDDTYNYSIDVSPEKVSVTNTGAEGKPVFDEMNAVCSLSYDNEYYYYFCGTAAVGETVTMERDNDGVIISSSDGTLKGSVDVYGVTPKVIGISAKDSVRISVVDKTTIVSLDKDGDGIYESPIEQGDVDGNGEITVEDAVAVLTYYAETAICTKRPKVLNPYYPLSLDTADMNGDEKIMVEDAVEILSKYAKRSAGLEG